ncbi:1-deoxy-D-xylulose-5-phosphate synthase [Bifidobacterium sp. 64T4]|uniref:1-deoxy-D-xylulose-5-phosphate synthase n=1 Tax=Bifidobacterium pongonis TaxID=2834432 RepID=UPI001C5942B0|nr:1-deoxy-D-xylulose-5-phosphate synthase [Bifidobacterium pongonis]MBW3094793.1 1-deoxy-D-xylulose-5-phosphate synthase [Bifidobacterium pongonis]
MTDGLLRSITGPDDVKALRGDQLPDLCAEIRETLLGYGHRHGGHIGSNLGLVEATVALHRVFDSPRDRIVFDVSHQSYVHKMLTGRAQAYLDPARAGETTGFTNPEESEHDQFVLGHTGTSISLACGLAKARDARGEKGNVIAVIGDGSLSSGVAFEGLNNVAEQGGNLIIVFNDNEMSIAEDFGGMYGPLARLRESGGTAQPNIFNAFGFDYRYVEQGNDVTALVEAFTEVKDIDHPVVVHIHTLKGLGLPAADDRHEVDHCDLSGSEPHAGRCEASHWQTPDAALGKPDDPRKYYGKLAMAALERRFAAEPGLTVISPATPGSNGITREFRERAGSHYVDTGITESHAVAFAAGIARAGGTPVVATTASFFQRAYDQFFQEMALNRQPVTLLSFLSGLSGSDNTHSGAYDIAMFGNIPGLICLAPTSGYDFLGMLDWATDPARRDSAHSDPIMIRVPGETVLAADAQSVYRATCESRGAAGADWLRWHTVRHGSEVAILGLGNTLPLALQAADALPFDATVVDPRQFGSLDEDALDAIMESHRLIVALEDGQSEGGWGEKVAAYCANRRLPRAVAPHVLTFGAIKEFTDRVPLDELDERYGLTVESVVDAVLGLID